MCYVCTKKYFSQHVRVWHWLLGTTETIFQSRQLLLVGGLVWLHAQLFCPPKCLVPPKRRKRESAQKIKCSSAPLHTAHRACFSIFGPPHDAHNASRTRVLYIEMSQLKHLLLFWYKISLSFRKFHNGAPYQIKLYYISDIILCNINVCKKCKSNSTLNLYYDLI